MGHSSDLDKTDGVTEEAGLAGNGTELSKNGAAYGAGPVLGTHDAEGWYPVTLTTTHTNTVGTLKIKSHDAATHLPVWHEWQVLEEAVYDALFAASAAGYGTAQTGDSFAIVNSGTHGNAAIKTLIDAVDNFVDTEIADIQARLPAALTADGNMKSDALRFGGTLYATALAAEVDAVWDEDATGHQTQGTFGQAIGDPGADSDTIWALVNTNLNATVSSRASQTSVDTIDDFLDTEIATIVTQTSAASIRTAVGLASANLDTQLAAIDDYIDTEIASLVTSVGAIWTTALTEGYRTDGSTGTGAQLLYEILAHHAEKAIVGTTLTTKKIDGSTTAATHTLDSSSAPTSITRSG